MTSKQKDLINKINDNGLYGILNWVKIKDFLGFLEDIMELYENIGLDNINDDMRKIRNKINIIDVFKHYNISIKPLYFITHNDDHINVLNVPITSVQETIPYLKEKQDSGCVWIWETFKVKKLKGGL